MKKKSSSASHFGASPFQKISKNVDFSLWGKQSGFPKNCTFWDFSLLCSINLSKSDLWIDLDHKILGRGYFSGKAKFRGHLYFLLRGSNSKYIVVRKFMKKQCVAPVAKKSDQLFLVLLFNGIFFFIFPIF